MNRRSFLGICGLGAAASLLSACQAAAPAPSPTAKPAAQPTSAPAQPQAPAPAQAPAQAAAKTAGSAEWDALVDAAKKEGRVVVSGPPTQAVRDEVPKAFKAKFGFDLEYLGGRSGDLMTRLKTERAAGQYTLDAMIAGATTLYTQAYPDKIIDPLKPQLIMPEVTDGSKWRRGGLWFNDPEEQYILRISNQLSTQIGVNTQVINPDEITSWKTLLEPRFKGKISAYDPTVSGAGSPTASYLLETLGEEFIRGIYRDQETAISREERQLSDWLARGTYPITLGLNSSELEPLRRDGFPIAVVRDLPDAVGTVSAGFGMIAILNKPANPNAAKVFVNWIASKEGSEVYNKAQITVSNRTDVESSWAPDYVIPKQGVQYFDIYDWNFTSRERSPEALERIKRLTAKA